MVDDGYRSNRVMGETSTEKISGAVVRAIREDIPEVIESGAPIRPMLALAQISPRLVEWLTPKVGVTDLFARVAASRGRAT
jgi:hypothetical protein